MRSTRPRVLESRPVSDAATPRRIVLLPPDVAELRKRMALRFSEVHLVKPEASRSSSTELYLVGKGYVPS